MRKRADEVEKCLETRNGSDEQKDSYEEEKEKKIQEIKKLKLRLCFMKKAINFFQTCETSDIEKEEIVVIKKKIKNMESILEEEELERDFEDICQVKIKKEKEGKNKEEMNNDIKEKGVKDKNKEEIQEEIDKIVKENILL